MGWKPEVIADGSGKWCGNALVFATEKEAEDNAFDLSMRWTAVRQWRAVESEDPVNYSYVNGKLEDVSKRPLPELPDFEAELDATLPEGVIMISLECPAEVHSILAKALGEKQ